MSVETAHALPRRSPLRQPLCLVRNDGADLGAAQRFLGFELLGCERKPGALTGGLRRELHPFELLLAREPRGSDCVFLALDRGFGIDRVGANREVGRIV